jgi:hypothetical protein
MMKKTICFSFIKNTSFTVFNSKRRNMYLTVTAEAILQIKKKQ